MPIEKTEQGINLQTLGEKKAELLAAFLASFPPSAGEAVDTSPDSYLGREVSIIAEQLIQGQTLTSALVTALDPRQAQGAFVDFHLSLQGSRRKRATRSTILAFCYGTPGLDIGDKRVQYLPTGTLWRTPIGTVIPANGIATVTLSSEDRGPIPANETDTSAWSIVDNVSGWTAVESIADATEGTDTESDKAGRDRVIASATSLLSGSRPAIERALRSLDGVASARVWNNRTMLPDVNGVPAKSIEAVVDGGSNADIGETLLRYANGTAGFAGTTTYEATIEEVDEEGETYEITETVKWSPLQRRTIIYDVVLTGLDTDLLPDDYESVVQNAVAVWTNALEADIDVYAEAAESEVWNALPPGSVSDVAITLAIEGTALGAGPIDINIRQRAVTDPAAQPGFVQGTEVEPFDMNTSWELVVAVDDGADQTIGFSSGGFLIVSEATALEVAAEINRQIVGATASVNEGAVVITSDTNGEDSSIEILNLSSGDLLTELGLSVGTETGSEGDITVTLS